MQFKVPQFLDIEDKIFGPFTFRQFVYLAGGAGFCFVLYKLLGLLWAALPILLVGGLSAALTFYRPNNKPFLYMLEAGFKYFAHSKLYIWEKRVAAKNERRQAVKGTSTPSRAGYTQKLDSGKLRDLAWSLDVLDLSKQKNN